MTARLRRHAACATITRWPQRAARTWAITTSTLITLAFAATASAPAAAGNALRFGAFTTGDPYWGHTHGTDALERATGRRVDIVNWYQSWGGGSWNASVQPHVLGAVASGGRTPLLTWEPWAPNGGTEQPEYRLARIADGEFDGYIAKWATDLAAHGGPVYLRPMHEMNTDWYPWSGVANGNTPERFVEAWRRIVHVFRRTGASNVRFVWSPNNVDVPASNALERYYPGADYVDVLALDGYNWGAGTPQYGGWQTFSQLFAGAYERLRALGPQPIWIAEVASSSDGGDKAAWVRDMFATARTMDRLEALVWFNEDKERDWRAAPTPAIAAAFAPDAGAPAEDAPQAAAHAPEPAPAPEPAAAAAAVSPPTLRLRIGRRARAGAPAMVRWQASGARDVVRWTVALDGRTVRATATATATGGSARARVARPGRHHWMVSGLDAEGRTVVARTRGFRVAATAR